MTSTPPQEQGPAVALSLGGKALRIAQQCPPHILADRNGLANLVMLLEQEFGPEEEDLQIDALDTWENYVRGRGQSIREFLTDFDYYLTEAQGRGYAAGPVIPHS